MVMKAISMGIAATVLAASTVSMLLWDAGGTQKPGSKATFMGGRVVQATTDPNPGQLVILDKEGRPGALCPLQGTQVDATVSGFGARVKVVQRFKNPSAEAIEAVYTFPLPNDAAVDSMLMRIGNRVVEGAIKRREEARIIYDAAKSMGQAAALLDQERPNIFTQSVANILPGATVEIEIGYVQLLKYREGEFEFSFPMVVGPRFLGNAKDPEKIAPPITPKGTRTGANIDMTVHIEAGAPVQSVASVLHAVDVESTGADSRIVRLARRDEIPNRDFILRYRVATDDIQPAFLTHLDPDGKGGFFTLILVPPKQPTPEQISPKEIILVMDQSGSQEGFPIAKSKELTLNLIASLRPQDRFNVIGFNSSVQQLWGESRPNTAENVAEATTFVKAMEANGGTQLREGVVAALQGQVDPDRLRIVAFNTDGFIGDEAMVLQTLKERRGYARMFTFGIGSSVNRYLIDAMSEEGRGAAEYVTLAEAADGAAERFIQRTRSPLLTDIEFAVDGQGVGVSGALPEALPDVFDQTPVVLYGRYERPGHATATITGKLGGRPWSKTLDLEFGGTAQAPGVMSLWARRQVDALTRANYMGVETGEGPNRSVQAITDLALEFGIMTEYTSFVAVEPRTINIGGKQRTVRVPVEMADGVSYEGIFGEGSNLKVMHADPSMFRVRAGGVRGKQSAGLGSGGLVPQANVPAVELTAGVRISFGGDAKIARAQMKPEEYRKYVTETKLAKPLRTAKGTVEIQIWLSDVSEATIKKLTKLGFEVALTDKGVKATFGTCDAKQLPFLAELDEVTRIEPIEAER